MIRVQADTFHDFTVVKIRNSMPCAGGGTKAAASAEKVCAAACGLEKPDVQFMSLEGAGQKEPGTDGLEQKEKRGRKSHMGIGLENVRHTLEKYEGGMMTEVLGEEFVVSLTIPV